MFMSFSIRYTRPMRLITLPLRANGRGHQLVVQRGPKSTTAMATRGSRPIALGTIWGRLDSVSITELCGEACALERSDAPIRIGAQLGRKGVQGLERALDRGAVGGGLRSQEANPRQPDIEGAKPPAPSPIAQLTPPREERAGQITPQAQHLAQDCVRSVEGLECALALLGEECLQGGLSLGRAPEVCARQRPPDAAQARCGGTPDRLPQSGNLRDLSQSTLGGRTGGSEAADRKLCVGQH